MTQATVIAKSITALKCFITQATNIAGINYSCKMSYDTRY